jgi:hypothetical protein
MNPIDCRSIHDHQDVDFHQPASVVGNIRGALNSFKTEQGHIVIHSFEIPPQLVMPL